MVPEATTTTQSSAARLGPWVELHEERCRGGRRLIIAANHRDGIAIQLTAEEADRCRTGTLDPDCGDPFVEELRSTGYLTDRPQHLDAMPAAPSMRERITRCARTLDLRVARADAFVRRLYQRGNLAALYSRAAVGTQICLAAAGAVALVVALSSDQPLELRAAPLQVPAFIALALLAGFVHEMGHAVSVVHYGRTVRAVGVRLHLGTPAFYVESADALLLTRRQRFIQAAAGPWAEWQLTSLLALVCVLAPSPLLVVVLYRFVVLNTITIASNLLPFVGLDGQLLLADAIREPDLPARTRGAATELLARLQQHQTITLEIAALAAYATLNAAVAGALVLVAILFWYAMFGDTIGVLLDAGPPAWIALSILITLMLRPAITRSRTLLTALLSDNQHFARLRFRLERRWRVQATKALARLPEFRQADANTLGLIAGRLRRIHIAAGTRLTLDATAFVAARRETFTAQPDSASDSKNGLVAFRPQRAEDLYCRLTTTVALLPCVLTTVDGRLVSDVGAWSGSVTAAAG